MGVESRHLLTSVLLMVAVQYSYGDCDYTLTTTNQGFSVHVNGVKVLEHSKADTGSALVYMGKGKTSFDDHLGNFDIEHYVDERLPLRDVTLTDQSDGHQITLSRADVQLEVHLGCDSLHPLVVTFGTLPPGYDRVWLRLVAEPGEHVYGGGEQFSHLDLRGRTFPIWTREQGVGRNKSTLATFAADAFGPRAGGDYHTTYFPQPTFISSRRFYCHFSQYNYLELDFTHEEFHEIYILGQPGKVFFQSGDMPDLVQGLTEFLGRPPVLPSWTSEGVILGVQGGTYKMLEILRQAQKEGVPVTGLWIQDWSGKLDTSFGQRLWWNWEWDQERYPRLDEVAKELKQEGVHLLGYTNPNLNTKGRLFEVGNKQGYFAKDKDGNTFTSDFGEFRCGFVDFTNPQAYEWYKDKILKKNMIGLGLSGWMADFGEYLPIDAVFSDGRTGRDMHNEYPVLWAKMNREAVEEMGKLGEVMYFMRAGGSGSSGFSTIMWAGDQNVDFSLDDGLASTVPAALSMGISGMGLTHYDIGGYTTVTDPRLFMVRSRELFFRGAEAAVFTPMMRTHEGNKPKANFQVYSEPKSLQQFGYLAQAFKGLQSYRDAVVKEVADTGLPAQRPLFLHYPDDPETWTIKYQYMFGRDLMVAPVITEKAKESTVFLPTDKWVYLFDSGVKYEGPISVTVPSPLGRPPVFYRASSAWIETFQKSAEWMIKFDDSPTQKEEL